VGLDSSVGWASDLCCNSREFESAGPHHWNMPTLAAILSTCLSRDYKLQQTNGQWSIQYSLLVAMQKVFFATHAYSYQPPWPIGDRLSGWETGVQFPPIAWFFNPGRSLLRVVVMSKWEGCWPGVRIMWLGGTMHVLGMWSLCGSMITCLNNSILICTKKCFDWTLSNKQQQQKKAYSSGRPL
jgi:hypothetical protein